MMLGIVDPRFPTHLAFARGKHWRHPFYCNYCLLHFKTLWLTHWTRECTSLIWILPFILILALPCSSSKNSKYIQGLNEHQWRREKSELPKADNDLRCANLVLIVVFNQSLLESVHFQNLLRVSTAIHRNLVASSAVCWKLKLMKALEPPTNMLDQSKLHIIIISWIWVSWG